MGPGEGGGHGGKLRRPAAGYLRKGADADPDRTGQLPGPVQASRQGADLECRAGISLFPYDNGTFIVYPYATSQAQPASIYIHVAGEAEALEMPVRKNPFTGEIGRIEPLYRKDGETVFQVRTQPGQYELYRIIG